MPDVQKILREIQRKTGENQAQLAKRFRVQQPTVSRWFSGAEPKGVARDRIMAQAARLGVITDGAAVEDDIFTVPIVGFVGAGGQILHGEGQGPFGEAKMPPKGAARTTVAVVVRGDSMAGQLEDGWTVYYDSRREPPTDELYNKLCVVGLQDGRVLIKKLFPGRKPGMFDLHSTNASVMLDQPVEWAARVSWIEPA
jgi:transcriptional regulator with XRE-family HTH domain